MGMNYRFNCDKWGADFSVPACLVTDYIKIVDGNYIKVLMCILSGSRVQSSEMISQKSGVDIKICDDAVAYWSSTELISATETNGNQIIPALPEKSQVKEPVSLVEAIRPTRNTVDKKVVVSYSQREIREKADNDANLKQLVNEIQSTLQFSINGKELGRLVELYEYYHFDVPTILLVAEYCSSICKRNIAYLYTIMVRWYEEDIVSYADVEKKIISCSEFNKFENKVLNIFGIENKPSKQQTDYIEKWRNMNFSIELLEIAYNKCMNAKSKLNFNYIDGILMKWADKSVTTTEQVMISDANFKSKSKYSSDNKSKETSYDLDEFEQFALNFNPNKK